MYDRKPNCSYNCLIGMALKSSESGRLPVGEIYRFFEREFPYFLTAAEPWKNSLRHSLSLGHYFRKYNSDKLVTKKGHLWEVDPQRASELDKEMYMFLAKGIPENTPTSPQLSKLRLQMTQLLLDSIKNTPLPCHSAAAHAVPQTPQPMYSGVPIGYTQPTSAQAFKRPDFVMLAQPGTSFSNTLPRQMYPSTSTPVGSPMASPASHRRSAMGCLLSSPRSKPAQSPQPPALKSTVSDAKVASESNANEERRERSHSAGLKSQKSQSANSSLCEEAYQLVQFCNHCTFGLDNGNNKNSEMEASSNSLDLSHQSMNGFSTPNQGTPLKPTAITAANPNQVFFCQEKEESHYPFIVPPTNERDIALSQLNNANYQSHPGPPKELLITKCKPQSSKGELCRTCREMDKAVRPVVYDWNGWWEEEHVVCMMNEESYANYVECRSEEDIMSILGKNSRRIRKILKPPSKPLNSSYITPTKPMPALAPMSEPTRQSVKRVYGQSWMKKFKVQKQNSTLDDMRRSNHKFCGKEASDAVPKSLVVDACKNLKLIVSIPFRKLITERQMKKYCGEGGKHRITTR